MSVLTARCGEPARAADADASVYPGARSSRARNFRRGSDKLNGGRRATHGVVVRGRRRATPVLKLSERAPPLVRDVFEEKGFREHEEGVDSEHHWHLHWKAGRFKPSEYEVASKLQRVNHFPKTTGITKKDCLLRNMQRMRGIHGPIYDFFPEKYLLPTST